MKKYLSLIIVLALYIVPLTPVFASSSESFVSQSEITCPKTEGWTKVDNGDLSSYPVEGATEYCFKAGSYKTNEIPDGGFGQEGACTGENIERCGLSHWSYYIPEPAKTETPTVTETPKETFQDLSLSVSTICDGVDSYLEWTVSNPNDFDVAFTWSASTSTASIHMVGYAESGSETVPALGTFSFTTSTTAQSVTIEFSDGEIEQEVSNTGDLCEEKQETTTPTDPTQSAQNTPTPTDAPAGGLGPSSSSVFFIATIGLVGLSLMGFVIKKSITK